MEYFKKQHRIALDKISLEKAKAGYPPIIQNALRLKQDYDILVARRKEED